MTFGSIFTGGDFVGVGTRAARFEPAKFGTGPLQRTESMAPQKNPSPGLARGAHLECAPASRQPMQRGIQEGTKNTKHEYPPPIGGSGGGLPEMTQEEFVSEASMRPLMGGLRRRSHRREG